MGLLPGQGVLQHKEGTRAPWGRAHSPCTVIYLLHSTWTGYHNTWCLEQVLNKHLSKETASQGTWAWVMTLPLISCAAQSLAWLCHFFLCEKGQEGRKRPLLFLRPLIGLLPPSPQSESATPLLSTRGH